MPGSAPGLTVADPLQVNDPWRRFLPNDLVFYAVCAAIGFFGPVADKKVILVRFLELDLEVSKVLNVFVIRALYGLDFFFWFVLLLVILILKMLVKPIGLFVKCVGYWNVVLLRLQIHDVLHAVVSVNVVAGCCLMLLLLVSVIMFEMSHHANVCYIIFSSHCASLKPLPVALDWSQSDSAGL